jgi:type I restriction enzyme, R subunit
MPDLSDKVALEYLRTEKDPDVELVLESTPLEDHELGTGKKEDEEEELSTIIERLNERFGTDFTDAEKLSIKQRKEDFANDKDLVLKARTNDLDDFRLAYDRAFMNKVVDRISNNEKFFARILDDEEFRVALMDEMLNETYYKLREEAV